MVFIEIILHNFKVLRSTILELITLLHNQETTKTNFTNNCLILATSTESTINYHKKNNGTSLLRQSLSLSVVMLLYTTTKNPVALYINRKKNPENARTKSREKRKKSSISYVIGQRNSSKKLDLLDQSGILLCRNKDCDVIKAYLQQIQLRGKKVFFQSVGERTNDTTLYTYVKTTLTRQISLFVTYTSFRFILLTLFVSRNVVLSFSRFLNSLLCDLIAPTPGLAFFLLM